MTVGGVIHMNAGSGPGAFAAIESASPNSINITFTNPDVLSGGYFVNSVEGILNSGSSGFFVGPVSNPTPAVLGQNFNVTYLFAPPPPSTSVLSEGGSAAVQSNITETLRIPLTTEPNQVTQDLEQAAIGGVQDEDKPAGLPVCR